MDEYVGMYISLYVCRQVHVNLYMEVCVHASYMYACMYLCMEVRIHMYVWQQTCMSIYVYVSKHVRRKTLMIYNCVDFSFC